MTPFRGLLWKDFHISKGWFVICLIGDLVFLAIPYVLGAYTGETLMIVPVALFMLFAFHVFFAPTMLLQMLHLEGKTQIWLHNPQSSRQLFLSKVMVSSAYQLASQLFLTLIGIVIYQFVKGDIIHLGTAFMVKATTFANISVLFIGLFFSCLVMFYWSVYHSLGKFSMVRSVRWLVLILIFTAYNIVIDFLSKFDFLQTIASQWTVKLNLDTQFSYEQGMWATEFHTAQFPIMIFVYYIVLGLGLFLFSSWLLDRKVEV